MVVDAHLGLQLGAQSRAVRGLNEIELFRNGMASAPATNYMKVRTLTFTMAENKGRTGP